MIRDLPFEKEKEKKKLIIMKIISCFVLLTTDLMYVI
jgi:hypothetical protein